MPSFRQVSLVAAAALALAAALPAQAQSRFTVSADGQNVTDSSTKLVWKRCVEGMNWDGKTCAGKPAKLKLDAARAAGKDGWRLPNKDELAGLMDAKGKKKVFDKAAFPGAPARLYWATRPESTDNLNQWLVDMGNGKAFGNTSARGNYVRLVKGS
jgi:hypothetical protein